MAHNEGFLNLVNDAKSRIQQTDIEGYKKLVAAGTPHVLIDTREDHEFASGHVAGALHLQGLNLALAGAGINAARAQPLSVNFQIAQGT